mgnify:FL=1
MAQLYTKVKLYLEANSKNWNDEQNNIRLQNDTGTDYIHTWNVSGLAKPNDDQLASYNSAATTEENNVIIRGTRRSAYGDISDQLDEIYKDIDAWKARIKSIKDANPKE